MTKQTDDEVIAAVKNPVCKHCGMTKRIHNKANRLLIWYCPEGGKFFEPVPSSKVVAPPSVKTDPFAVCANCHETHGSHYGEDHCPPLVKPRTTTFSSEPMVAPERRDSNLLRYPEDVIERLTARVLKLEDQLAALGGERGEGL